LWVANFRDLNSSLARMMALCEGNRIGVADVENEMARLRNEWRCESAGSDLALLESILDRQQLAEIDLFDRLQLTAVLEVCRSSASMAEAGRRLFAGSLQKKRSTNDSDRLRKYLQRFGISWKDIVSC